MKDLEALRKAGLGGGGYTLVTPFGDKRQLRANEGMNRRFSK